MDRRKVSIIAVALLAAALLPAQSDARTDVPVESVIGNDQANASVPFRAASRGNSTGAAIVVGAVVADTATLVSAVTAPATASQPAERLTPPAPIVEPTVEEIIRQVWPDQLEDRAVRIAWRESRFVPTAHNSCCYGIMQIYFNVHRAWLGDFGVYTPSDLYDPRVNATVALALYNEAGWSPWQT